MIDRWIKKIRWIGLTIVTLILCTEALLQWRESQKSAYQQLMDLISLDGSSVDDSREINSRFIISNIIHFNKLFEKKISPEIVFIGTSRTKVLTPHQHFQKNALVVGGNSYNEITWGLLLEAEALRILSPEIKTFWFEASFLLRRPGQLSVSDDHRKYTFLIKSLMNSNPKFGDLLPDLKTKSLRYSLLKQNNWQLVKVFKKNTPLYQVFKSKKIKTYSDNTEVKKINEFGEQNNTSLSFGIQPINTDSIKILRLQNSAENIPGDRLFEAIILWAQTHKIKVGFYIPPITSTLVKAQEPYGLQKHISDLIHLSKTKNVQLVNFMDETLDWTQNSLLFADEDHLATCIGSYSLTSALLQANESVDFQLKNSTEYRTSNFICQQ